MRVDDEAVREATFFREAYEAVASMRSAMLGYLEWGPHGGAVFIAWADLEDVYDTGTTPIPDAHAALREAARGWLARPQGPHMTSYIENWIVEAGQAASMLVKRDGGFWTSPS